MWQGPGSFNLSDVVSRWSLPMGASGDGDRGSDGIQLKQLTVMQGESC